CFQIGLNAREDFIPSSQPRRTSAMNCSPLSCAFLRSYPVLPMFLLLWISNWAVAADDTDVTKVVTAAVKNNQLSITASNETFGDTAPGIPKKLRLEYQVGDEKLSKEVNEGSRLEISAPAGAK